MSQLRLMNTQLFCESSINYQKPCSACGRVGSHFCSGFPQQYNCCINPEHNPPMHLFVEPGQMYVHVCPGCGWSYTIHGGIVTHFISNQQC